MACGLGCLYVKALCCLSRRPRLLGQQPLTHSLHAYTTLPFSPSRKKPLSLLVPPTAGRALSILSRLHSVLLFIHIKEIIFGHFILAPLPLVSGLFPIHNFKFFARIARTPTNSLLQLCMHENRETRGICNYVCELVVVNIVK